MKNLPKEDLKKAINYIFDSKLEYKCYNISSDISLPQFYTKVFINHVLPLIEEVKQTPSIKITNLIKVYYNNIISKESFLRCLNQFIEDPELNFFEVILPEVIDKIKSEEKIDEIIDQVFSQNCDKVQQYKQGNEKLLGFFVGLVMKQLKGIEGNLVKEKIIVKLNGEK